MNRTLLVQATLVVAVLAAVFFAARHFARRPPDESVPPPKTGAREPGRGFVLPGSRPGCGHLPEIRFYHPAWDAQMGLLLANGGPRATEGSLMCGHGVNLKLIREDDPGKTREALIAFARELKSGAAQPTQGAAFVTVRGDVSATFLKSLNDALRRLGPEYTARVVGAAGSSRGEDQLLGSPEWQRKPAAAKGALVAGVPRESDWNVAQKWLGDNGLCNNPDEKTWDPGCLNWAAAPDSVAAAEKYVANHCENRPVVQNGRRTGVRKRVCVEGVATSTPGGLLAARKRGGLVTLVSTREYSAQVPGVILGIDKWMKDNRPIVEGLLQALFEGGDAVKINPAALRRAAEISAAVYGDDGEPGAGPDFWEKYSSAQTERDKLGLLVQLGGSSVDNLADNLLLFGLAPGSANLFAATYTAFGDVVQRQYPDLLPSYDPVEEILDTSYLQAVAARMPSTSATVAAAETPTFSAGEPVRNVVSRRAWNIGFETGRATFTPGAERQMRQLLRDLLVANAAAVEVHGHAEGAGSPEAGARLSGERAFAVKQWLERQSPANFPEGRVRVFAHGRQNPVTSPVEIVIGTAGAS
ncbi:MAG TPA: OmpA family protein [Thermoanaerobaculia bacterium]|jgi:outer membrane protein OmpA-like peptidoglycan-associated protein|nr:OmpA family protein [Thermoanaerobaculia bacterium]